MSLLKISTNFADRTEVSATGELADTDTDTISQVLTHFHGNHDHHHHNLQTMMNIILGWGWITKNFLCCTATSVTVSIWYKTKALSWLIGWLADRLLVCFIVADWLFFIFPVCWLPVWSKKVRHSVSNIHHFWFRFPWMQDDLEAPAAAANEELKKQNDDLSQPGQVWNYTHGILCHQCVFIHTAHILDIDNE